MGGSLSELYCEIEMSLRRRLSALAVNPLVWEKMGSHLVNQMVWITSSWRGPDAVEVGRAFCGWLIRIDDKDARFSGEVFCCQVFPFLAGPLPACLGNWTIKEEMKMGFNLIA